MEQENGEWRGWEEYCKTDIQGENVVSEDFSGIIQFEVLFLA